MGTEESAATARRETRAGCSHGGTHKIIRLRWDPWGYKRVTYVNNKDVSVLG